MLVLTTWPDVGLALIAALPAIIAALAALGIRNSIKTPSGMQIGYVAERAHDLSAIGALRPGQQINGTIPPAPAPGQPETDTPNG